MTEDEPKAAEPNLDEDDEWQLYASAGYPSTGFVLDEVETVEDDNPDDVWFDGDAFDFEGNTVNWDAPPCPAPLGIAHLIKIGICDFCLHRIGGRRSEERGAEAGAVLRKEAYARDEELKSKPIQDFCPLCENLFEDVDNIVERVFDSLSGTDYSTIQFGIHLPKDLIQEEDRIRSRYGAPVSYPLKSSLVEAIHHRIRYSNKEVGFVKERPDIMVLVDGLTLRVDVDVRPIFLYGRYRKLVRDLPQTRWPCRACRGKSDYCESCNGTGLQYPDSVQDLIGEPIREALGADDTSFHGMGREDIDVRCLGSGRPFVIEVKRPSKRNHSLDDLVRRVNENASGKVEIDGFSWCARSKVNEVKGSRSEKTYTIRFTADDLTDEDTVTKAISSLSGVVIDQETPKRVSHRRASKIRRRRVVSVDNILIDGNEAQFSLRCEAGTYIKEFVHSDEGRTKPSVQSAIGRECEVLWLDVEEIHAD